MGWGDSGMVLSSMKSEMKYVPKGEGLITWRLCTNFIRAEAILVRFREWPDSLLEPERLESLYRGELKAPILGLAAAIGDTVRPLFPYLDETQAEVAVKVYEAAKTRIYPPFAAFLDRVEAEALCGAEGMLLPAQTLLVFALREREREIGIWDMRTSEQRLGTVFALGTHVTGTYSRVSALIAGKDMRLCVPWGGFYREYSKILPVLEDPSAGWILRTADEDLNVMMAGLVSRPLVLLEFIDTSRMLARRGNARLNVDALPALEVIRGLPALRSAIREVAIGASQCMNDIVQLWKTGRYSYLEGPGDYLEMTYAVLLGLLFSWAMEDDLLRPPPTFVRSGENLVLRKPIWAAIARRKTQFNGMCVLREAGSLWDSLVGVDEG
jgi:hypothetical protein